MCGACPAELVRSLWRHWSRGSSVVGARSRHAVLRDAAVARAPAGPRFTDPPYTVFVRRPALVRREVESLHVSSDGVFSLVLVQPQP